MKTLPLKEDVLTETSAGLGPVTRRMAETLHRRGAVAPADSRVVTINQVQTPLTFGDGIRPFTSPAANLKSNGHQATNNLSLHER